MQSNYTEVKLFNIITKGDKTCSDCTYRHVLSSQATKRAEGDNTCQNIGTFCRWRQNVWTTKRTSTNLLVQGESTRSLPRRRRLRDCHHIPSMTNSRTEPKTDSREDIWTMLSRTYRGRTLTSWTKPIANRRALPKNLETKTLLPGDQTKCPRVRRKRGPATCSAEDPHLGNDSTALPQTSWTHAYTDGPAENYVRNAESGAYIKYLDGTTFSLSVAVGLLSANYRVVQAFNFASEQLIAREEKRENIVKSTMQTTIFRLLTGHCGLKKHQKKMWLAETTVWMWLGWKDTRAHSQSLPILWRETLRSLDSWHLAPHQTLGERRRPTKDGRLQPTPLDWQFDTASKIDRRRRSGVFSLVCLGWLKKIENRDDC